MVFSLHPQYTKRHYDTKYILRKVNTIKMIKRRKFLILSSIFGLSPYLQGKEFTIFEKEFKKIEPTISAVQVHMFPTSSQIPSAESMNVTQFLLETLSHKSYDKDIRAFVLEGAQELNTRESGHFRLMSHKDKEKALRAYEGTQYGSNWLSRIMTLTIEAMFSDPIYGSNINEAGWKALGSYGGQPRPKTRYIAL